MNKLLREPLLHFLLLGALLFAAHAVMSKPTPAASGAAIKLTQGQVDALAAEFERKWQRAPSLAERGKMLDGLIRDEILYREGVALGLDRDDALIRRRVSQKVELLAEEAQLSTAPGETELEAYLQANRSRYEVERRVSFRQVFLDPMRWGPGLEREAERRLAILRNERGQAVTIDRGDAGQLAQRVDAAPLSLVGRDFGGSFAGSLLALPRDAWQGPLRSGFGLHLVLVTELTPARAPALAEVRGAVERDWARERRVNAADAMYRQLRERYTVSVEGKRLESS